MRILIIMSEEEESIHDNADLSNSEDEEASTEPEIKPVIAPELEPGPEGEIISPVTEESGVEEAATEEAMREKEEQIRLPEVEQSQLRSQIQAKPKSQAKNTDTSKQIEKQTAQINKINQNLQSLQKQFKSGQKQSEILIQMRSQITQIRRQVSQVQKSIKRR
jgi:hypothetical protein